MKKDDIDFRWEPKTFEVHKEHYRPLYLIDLKTGTRRQGILCIESPETFNGGRPVSAHWKRVTCKRCLAKRSHSK